MAGENAAQQNLYQYQLGGSSSSSQPNPPGPSLRLPVGGGPAGAPPERERAPKSSSQIPFLERLRALPEVRSIPWRPGQELPREKAIDSPRVQQRGAILLSTRGNVVESACSHCAGGFGRFAQCITLDPWFQGACSTCIFTSKGNKCSLRFQTSGTADGRALRYHSSNPEMLQTFMTSQPVAESAKPARKRKRAAAPANAQTAVPASTSESNWQHQQQVSPDMDRLIQAEIARDESSIPHPPGPQGEKRQKPESFLPSPEDMTRGNPIPAGGPLREIQPPSAPPPPQAWTAANNPPNSTASQPINYIRQMYQPPMQSGPSAALPPSAPPQNVRQSPSVPLNNLPRPKQLHVLGLLTGLQGNIDNLQSQLNTLKTALGIDLDESSTTH
ncbi:hypothetical protein HYALB_00000125 [Hymenoscyphus albidus]|uniref:Uncharacterized protein n=1 Tax=Hymenoscyphus albidus TaxID=595503 RepID=A0A9N9LIF4_9HELO|nr:hypothetical protein HYALB_00000125 [Hymenoscyphus albidus]